MNPAVAVRIAERDLKSQVRARSFVSQALLLPMLLTLIIGTALGGTGSRELPPNPIAIVGADDELSRGLARELEKTANARVQRMTLSQATEAVLSGRLVALVEIPEGLRRAAARPGKSGEVRVLTDPASRVGAVAVGRVTQSYLDALEAGRAATLATVQALRPQDAPELGRLLTSVEPVISARLSNPRVSFRADAASGQSAGYFAYYAVAFGVMFTLLTATQSAGGLLEEAERGTLSRLLAAPVSTSTLLAGKLLALYGVAVLQLGLFVVATWLIYGVNWGAPPGVLVGVLAVAAAAAGLGGVVIGVTQSIEQVGTTSLMLVILMSLLGGSMYPVESLPGIVQTLSRFTFNRWAIDAFQTLRAPGLGLADAALPLGVLLAVAALGAVFGTARLASRFRA